MSGDRVLPVWAVGALLLLFTLRSVDGGGDPSWIPTLVFVPAVLLLLVGQLWFVAAFAEQPEASGVALFMFVLLCGGPYALATLVAWDSSYDFIRWTALVLLVLESVAFVLALAGGGGGGGRGGGGGGGPPPGPRVRRRPLPG